MKEMMKKALAHSKTDKVPVQTHYDHAFGGYQRIMEVLDMLKNYMPERTFLIVKTIVIKAILYHDLGKLTPAGREILNEYPSTNRKFPNHVAAGSLVLLKTKRLDDRMAAWAIYSHHRGLPNYPHLDETLRDLKSEGVRGRSPWMTENCTVDAYMAQHLPMMLNDPDHLKLLNDIPISDLDIDPDEITAPLMRLILSILVDADYYDTAKNYLNYVPPVNDYLLRPEERLAQFDRMMAEFKSKVESEVGKSPRNKLRSEVGEACRNSVIDDWFTYLSAEVGLGKTLAILAYVLPIAVKRKMRKIIYSVAYTTVASQTGNRWDDYLVLPGEAAERAHGRHHHQMAFTGLAEKVLTTTWVNPIIATTLVQLIETLTSNRPGKLRKYFNLAGSFIVIDEIQCIPPEVWPLLMKELAFLCEYMGCRVLFVSGSMVKPWDIPSIQELIGKYSVDPILPAELSARTLQAEKNRVKPILIPRKLDLAGICDHILTVEGSRFAIFNTLQNAAVVAMMLQRQYPDLVIEHLSTALTPYDRQQTVDRIYQRLKNKETFVLIATSCVESGVDYDFYRFGFRENASLNSTIQAGGRANREGNHEDAILYVFELDTKGKIFTKNPQLETGQNIQREFFKKGWISPEYCHKAFAKEFDENGTFMTAAQLVQDEDALQLETIGNMRVIDDEKESVIIDISVLDNFIATERWNESDRHKMQMHSVQIYRDKLPKLPIEEITIHGMDFKIWRGQYDSFLGYMADPRCFS